MEKEIQVDGKSYKIRELLFVEIINIPADNKQEASKKMIQLATGISDDDFQKLTVKEGLKLMETINEMNGFTTTGFPTV